MYSCHKQGEPGGTRDSYSGGVNPLHDGQSAPRSGGAHDVVKRRGEPHTEHGLGG